MAAIDAIPARRAHAAIRRGPALGTCAGGVGADAGAVPGAGVGDAARTGLVAGRRHTPPPKGWAASPPR